MRTALGRTTLASSHSPYAFASLKFDCDIPYTGHLDANIQFHGCSGEP